MPAPQRAVLCNGCTQKPHAVILPWPGQGHINPLLHLSKRLASEYGFLITFVNLEFAHRFITEALQRQESEKLALAELGIRFVSLPDGISAEATRTGNIQELCQALSDSGPAFEQLLSALRPPATCIISDVFALPTQDAANKAGIPRAAFWTQSAVTFSAHLLAARGLLAADCERGTLIRNLAGAPGLRVKDLPGYLQNFDDPDYMFEFSWRPFTRLEEARCLLMNSFEAMEGEPLRQLQQLLPGCRLFAIGPVLPPAYFCDSSDRCCDGGRCCDGDGGSSCARGRRALAFWAEDYSCLQWLDGQQEASVLYVSFGSIAELTEEELQELALGLEASGAPVLWVLRPGGLAGGGHASLPAGFTDRTNGHVRVVDWAPQLEVLAHPAVGGFFTHAGWNSTLEGVGQGKPLLGFPYFGDQVTNAKCIQDLWGIGLAFERQGEGPFTRSLVESKVRALMTDPKLRQAALSLRNGARHAVACGSNLDSFVQILLFDEVNKRIASTTCTKEPSHNHSLQLVEQEARGTSWRTINK